uniref:DUF362 domain-containing protein n=1 Tax=Strongyloides papillosus TaxID=174720 RepID=A0A0N5BDQ1_STREA
MVYIDLASSRKRPAQDYTEAALSIDDLVFKFLLKHPHSEEFVSDLYDLLRNISVLCCESSLSASLSISKFHKQFLVAEKEIIKLSKDVYSIDLNRDFNRYVEEYKIPKNNLISHSSLNFILYFDDIAVNSPLGAFAKTGLQTHCAYKLILDPFNASSGALSNYRTYAFVKASIAKGTDKYKQFFLDCINSFLNSRIIIDNVEIGVKIHCVTGDHPVLQNLFGFKLNFRSIGKVGSCRACTIPNEKFSEFRTIESTEKYLRTNHDLEHLLPKYCNYVTDPHHDWSQGIG